MLSTFTGTGDGGWRSAWAAALAPICR